MEGMESHMLNMPAPAKVRTSGDVYSERAGAPLRLHEHQRNALAADPQRPRSCLPQNKPGGGSGELGGSYGVAPALVHSQVWRGRQQCWVHSVVHQSRCERQPFMLDPGYPCEGSMGTCTPKNSSCG